MKRSFEMTAAEYVAEIGKALPDFEVQITPTTVMDADSADTSATITVKGGSKSESCTIPLKLPSYPPRHSAILMSNIANLICRITNEKDDLQYHAIISSQLAKYFGARNKQTAG